MVDKIASLSSTKSILTELEMATWKAKEFYRRESKYRDKAAKVIKHLESSKKIFKEIQRELEIDTKMDNYTLEDIQNAYDEGYKIQRCLRVGAWGTLRNRPTEKDLKYKYRVCKGELVKRLNGSSQWIYTEINYHAKQGDSNK